MQAIRATIPGSRYEIKYLLPPEVRVAVHHDLEAFMDRDTHATNAPGTYDVSTLYFDTPGRACFFEKIDGVAHRTKFRLRRYGDAAAGMRLEKKEKHVDRIVKHRVTLDESAYDSLFRGVYCHALDGNAVYNAFWAHRARFALQPWIVVDYTRSAFTDRTDRAVRATIDLDLRAYSARRFEQRLCSEVDALPKGTAILELKWDRGFPVWLQQLVRKFGLRHAAISKYCLGIDALVAAGRLPHA